MQMAEAPACIDRLAKAFAVELTAPQASALFAYVDLVAQWNRKIDLTAARDVSSLVEVLLGDAFVLSDEALTSRSAKIVDVGTGAGAPIVPLLLLREDLAALCVEPLRKRATFLRMLSARLSLLARMRVDERRIDPERPTALAEPFDLACSRATFAPERWLRVGLTLAPAVLVLATDAQPALPEGVVCEGERRYALPFSGAPRLALRYCSGRSGRGLRC